MFYSCETKQGFEKVSMLTIVLKAGASILCRTDRQKCLILFQTQNFLYQNENLASEFTLVTIWHTTIFDVMTHESCYIIYVTQNIVLSSQYCVNVYCPCDEIRSDCSVLLPNMVSQASKKKIIYSCVSLYFCWDGSNAKKRTEKIDTLCVQNEAPEKFWTDLAIDLLGPIY